MWLATLLICITADVFSCEVSTQPSNLYLTEQACLEEVTLGVAYFSSSSVFVSGGCIKIGGYA